MRDLILQLSKSSIYSTKPVSTRAVLDVLHQNLPDNGSELVLFDINRAVNFRALFRHSSDRALSHLLATPERTFTTTIVKNASSESMKMVASTHLAHTTTADVQPLNLLYPRDVFLYHMLHSLFLYMIPYMEVNRMNRIAMGSALEF
jgi:hypothetical protein